MRKNPASVCRSWISRYWAHHGYAATLAQTKGDVKDVQAILSHSKADTTVNDYMQQIEAGVKQTLDGIYSELTDPKSPQKFWKFGTFLVRASIFGWLRKW